MIRDCPACGARNRIPASRLHQHAHCGSCKAAIGPVDAPWSAASAAEFDDLVSGSSLPVLVDFWAAWCGPCRVVGPELEKVARRRAGKLLVAKLDTDAHPDVAGRYGIHGIPTMILFDKGREVRRISGAMPASQIESQLGL